jgi:hypothetical protein
MDEEVVAVFDTAENGNTTGAARDEIAAVLDLKDTGVEAPALDLDLDLDKDKKKCKEIKEKASGTSNTNDRDKRNNIMNVYVGRQCVGKTNVPLPLTSTPIKDDLATATGASYRRCRYLCHRHRGRGSRQRCYIGYC